MFGREGFCPGQITIHAIYSVKCLIMIQASEDDSIFEDPPTHTLYLSARAPSTPNGVPFLHQSPLATLDRYVGYPNERHAPHWVRWTRSSAVFRYRAASFAKLFLKLATWKVNSDQVRHSTLFQPLVKCSSLVNVAEHKNVSSSSIRLPGHA